MAAGYPGGPGPNTFVPNMEASGNYQVEFSRDPKSFRIADYCKYQSVSKTVGKYVVITPEMASRLLLSNIDDLKWARGADGGSKSEGTESFEFKEFRCERYKSAWALAYEDVDQADWDIAATHGRIHAQRLMTARTQRAVTVAESTSLFTTDTATSLGGGLFSAGTTADPIIKKAFMAAFFVISKATQGAVTQQDVGVLLSPDLADAMARSREIHEYLMQSPVALAQVRGDVESQNGLYGLPDKLYNFQLWIEDAVKTTSERGAALAQSYVKSSNSCTMLSRPGGLEHRGSAPNFSTLTMFNHEDLTVEMRDDVDNRRYEGRVVDDNDIVATATAAGYVITATLS